VIETMSQRAIFAAKLAGNAAKHRKVFTANGLSLFPLHWLISAANAPAQTKPTPASGSVITTSWAILQRRPVCTISTGVALKTKSSPTPTGLLALKLLTLKHPTFKKEHPTNIL